MPVFYPFEVENNENKTATVTDNLRMNPVLSSTISGSKGCVMDFLNFGIPSVKSEKLKLTKIR